MLLPNKMEHQQNFFLHVLRSGLKNNEITDVKIVKEFNNDRKGQNFLSTLSQITLEYFDNKIKKTIHLFTKTGLSDQTHKLMFEMDVFEIETEILSFVLPEIEQIVGIKFGPKFIYHLKEPPAILMEDLTKFEFNTKDQKFGLSKDYMVMVIEALAKYHAGSIAFDEKQPGFLQKYCQSLFSRYTHPNFMTMIATTFEELGKLMFGWSDPICVKAASKVQNLSKNIIEISKKNIDYDQNEFCVLNHGDCWVNNIMFRENDANEPLEVRLIDFQLPVWSSPAVDLQYTLSLCPEFDMKYKLDDFFLEKYLITLEKTMQTLGCKKKPPSFDELKLSMWKRRSLAVISGLVFYPKIMVKVEDIGTIKEVLDNKMSNINVYETPEVIEKFTKLIPLLDSKGYLD